MESNNQHIEINELIYKVLSGNASAHEKETLNDWINESHDNKVLYDNEVKLWNELEKAKSIKDIDVDSEWDNLKAKTFDKKSIKLQNNMTKARISLFKYAAVITLLAFSAVVIFYYINNPSENKLIAKNQVEKYTLPDGSVITLNKDAVLSYPKTFSSTERKVKLEKGEAFFDVVSDAKNPFFIETSEIKIKVVGTSFYIHSEENGDVTIIVEEGVVNVYKNNNENDLIELKQGEKAVFSSSSKEIMKSVNEDDNYLIWKTNKLVFKNKSLSKIVDSINKYFNSNIVIVDENISDCRYSTQFDLTKGIENVINILQALDLNVNQSENKIEISGEGC
ncbi:MAG: FecR family protein [Marinilabiliales bacterium]